MRGLMIFAAGVVLAVSDGAGAVSYDAIPALKPEPQSASPGTWQTRLKAKADLVGKGGAKYVFLGDSITHFWETNGKAVWQCYFDGPDAPYPSLNLGYSGDRAELFTDKLHPSAAGYRVWLEALVPVVDRLIKREAVP